MKRCLGNGLPGKTSEPCGRTRREKDSDAGKFVSYLSVANQKETAGGIFLLNGHPTSLHYSSQ